MENKLTVRQFLDQASVKKRFRDILGNRAGGFISSILSAVSMNKDLALCPPESVVSSAAIAASLNLPINPSLGMAHIVPYRNKQGVKIAQFQMGWKGFIQLAVRSGKYNHINVTEVYEGDIKSINRFTGVITFNEGQIDNYKNRPIVGYLLYFCLVAGYEKFFYMTKQECEAHGKKYSKSYETGNWKKDFDSMAKKTVVKMGLSKYGILSVEMEKAISTDQGVVDDSGEVVDYPDNPQNETRELSDDEVIVEQSPKQKYNTLKLEAATKGKLKELNAIIKAHQEESGKDEASWSDVDFNFLNKNIEEELNKK